jgi:two-component system sensor histidine kinase YesM
MKFTYSLRFKLSLIFFLTIFIPLLIIVFIIPSYFSRILTVETQTLTKGTLTALTRNIETYLDDLKRLTITPYLNDDIMYALKLKASGEYKNANDYAKLVVERSLNKTLPNLLQYPREDISSTLLLPFDGSIYARSYRMDRSADFNPSYSFSSQPWYKKAVAAKGQAVFISVHPQDYFTLTEVPQVFSVARLITDLDSGQPLAVIIADADTVVLEHIVQDVKFNVTSIVALFDEQDHLIYSNDSLTAAMQKQIIKKALFIKSSQGSFVTVSKIIQPANWRMVVLLSRSELQSKVRYIYRIALLLTIAGLILTFVLYSFLSRWIINPFHKMAAVMRQVRQGNLDARFHSKGRDEIDRLGEALNKMIIQLNELIDREYRAVLKQRETEYQALQSQIQPHFLYNTLNGFIGLNRIGDRVKLEKAILSLTGMLRYILEHGDLARVTEEFLFLQRYCELQQLRFEERLQFEITFDPEIANCMIPKLLVQPLVENAIIHGCEPSDQLCTLKINGSLEKRDGSPVVRLTIKDDGVGFSAEEISQKINIGIENVRERLKILYANAVFSLSSQKGQGTLAVIEIPLQEVLK